MNAQALLAHLRQCDVKVWLEGDRLRINVPKGVLTPDASSYNIALSTRLWQQIDARVLERCLTEIIRRHEVLRTTFVTVAGQPVQRILPAMPFQRAAASRDAATTGR